MATILNSTGVEFPDLVTQHTANGNKQFVTEAVLNNSASFILYTSDAYANYEVVFRNVVPVSDGTTLQAYLVFNGAFRTGNYYYNAFHYFLNNNSGNYGGANYNYIPLTYPGAFENTPAGSGISGFFRIYDCRNTSYHKNYEYNTFGQFTISTLTGYIYTYTGGGFYQDASNNGLAKMDGITIAASSGNLSSGTVTLYGWN